MFLMEQSIVSSNPILFMVAVLLTFMACYTSLDLLTSHITLEKYKRLLYLGFSCSKGVAIWTLNFLAIFTFENNELTGYDFSCIILSLFLGMILVGLGLLAISHKIKFLHIIFFSFMLTMALFLNYLIGLYVLTKSLILHPWSLGFAILIVFSLFVITLVVLFYNKKVSLSSIKPVSTFILSGAIIEGYFLFLKGIPVTVEMGNVNRFAQLTPLMLYLVSFVSLLILAGLIRSGTIVERRLASSDCQSVMSVMLWINPLLWPLLMQKELLRMLTKNSWRYLNMKNMN
jgi:NO-binding membrane sensor protein with MHYT domain